MNIRVRHAASRLVPALLAVVLFAGFRPPTAGAAASQYVCPPCGVPCDTMVFDHPGVCPTCGMTLVEKGSAAAASPAQANRTRVAIVLFDGVEIVDFTGPYEFFVVAGYDVYTVSQDARPITTAGGMVVTPKYSFGNAPQPDVMVVPGGGVGGAVKDDPLLKYVVDVTPRTRHTMSVCNGSFILASAGVLDGLRATSTYGNVVRLQRDFPRIHVVSGQRYVDNGRIITTAGLTSGIDGTLHVISQLDGEKAARDVALAEEYDWHPTGGYVRPSLADRWIPRVNVSDEAVTISDWKQIRSEGDADRWEVVLQGSTQAPASEILASMGHAFEEQAQWTALPSGANASSRSWSFKDLDGKPWKGTLSVEEAKPGDHQFTMTTRVTRGG